MLKTLEQATFDFMDIDQLAQPDFLIDYDSADIERQLAELEAFIISMELGGPRVEKVFEDQKPRQAKTGKKPEKRNLSSFITDIVLYSAVLFILFAIVAFNGKTKKGYHIFGYSGFTVLSEDMRSEISKGSLILAKQASSDEIMIGDDITFVNRDNSIVTHRVIEIVENLEDSNDRGFRTQGIANGAPDPDVLYADDIIGVVKYAIPGLGSALIYISDNIGMFLLISILLLGIIKVSAGYAKKRKQR